MSSVRCSQTAPSVLFVLPDLGKNGAVQQTIAIAEGVALWGPIASTVYCLERPPNCTTKLSVPLKGPFRTHIAPIFQRIKGMSRVRAKFHSLCAIPRLLVEARKHDVLFASFEAGPALTNPAYVARILRKPFCVIIHSNIPKSLGVHFALWPVARTQAIMQRADHIICVANGLEPVMQYFLENHMPPHSTIRNGIDTASLTARLTMVPDCQVAFTVQPNGRYFLAIGRISHEKGLDLLIAAHAKACKSGEDHCLVLAGDGPVALKLQLQQQACDLGVAQSVVFLGHCKNPIGLLGQAYGFCLTSRYEGFSLALAEAAAVGTPCIAMDCTAGPNEILEGGKYGILVPNGDIDAMAAAMIAHLRDPDPLRQKAAASRLDAARLDTRPLIEKYAALIMDITQHQETDMPVVLQSDRTVHGVDGL